MILAYHFIFSAYGFWLPNDPRGSWSDTVRVFDLLKFGPATKVTTTRNLARDPHDRARRIAAKEALKYPPVRFTGVQARAIGRGFAIAAKEAPYTIRALAILPDHTHLIVERHQKSIDQIARHLKAKATTQLVVESLHPLAPYPRIDGTIPSPWSRSHWCPFIQSPAHLATAIRYVERNPIRAGLKPQRWNACRSA